MSIKASIDIGSNSILLLVVDFSKEPFRVLESHSCVTGLGRNLDKNLAFISEAMDDSFAVLKKYASICLNHGLNLENVIITATEASRVARNSQGFFKHVYEEIGLRVRIITSEAEAYYSAVGILIDDQICEDKICIMDIGGASTELMKVDVVKKEILYSFSMPVGAVRMNDWLLKGIRDEHLNKVLEDFKSSLERVLCHKLYCVAGTMTSVGNMHLNKRDFVEDQVNGLTLTKADLEEMRKKFENYSAKDFLNDFPFLGKRSHTIQSGLILADTLLERLGVVDIYISTFGLRYGSIQEKEIPAKFLS